MRLFPVNPLLSYDRALVHRHEEYHIDPEYIKSVNNLPDAERERFVEGNWESTDEPDQLIKFETILQARNLEPVYGKRSLGVDVARFGNDDTTIAHRNGKTLTGLEYHDGLSIDRTADLVQALIVDGKDGRLVTTPVLPASTNRTRRT